MATTAKTKKYIEGVGRRKTAVARVRITPGKKKTFTVNGIEVDKYFTTVDMRQIAHEAMAAAGLNGKFEVTVVAKGGGLHAQAEAVRLGLARAAVKNDPGSKAAVKPRGMLTRDAREKERRKFGLKKARKAPQWSKR